MRVKIKKRNNKNTHAREKNLEFVLQERENFGGRASQLELMPQESEDLHGSAPCEETCERGDSCVSHAP